MASNGGGPGGKMKLKLNRAQAAASTPKPVEATPTQTPSIKLNLGARSSQTPAASPAQKTQTPLGQTPKGSRKGSTVSATKPLPTPSSATSKTSLASKKTTLKKAPDTATKPPVKAIRFNSISAASKADAQRKPSLIRLGSGKPAPSPFTSKNPRLRLKNKGKIPTRPLGVGYDSECDEVEEDPAHEENFILRMPPGADCEYVRKAIEDKKVGLPLSEGGADISMHVFSARRSAVKVRGRTYAAVMVDLPSVTETMKSWDRKGWWKSADISQMMLVTRQVDNEDDARHAPLPVEIDDKTWQWPHGLTPPMHNVRRRRFRKRVSHRTIEQAEEEVERLLAEDELAQRHGGLVRSELLDLEQLRREEEGEDGEGDMDVDGDSATLDDADEDYADWAAQFEAFLGEEDDAIAAAGTPVPPQILAAEDGSAQTPVAGPPDADGDVEMADSPAQLEVSDATLQGDSQPQTPAQAESSSSDDDEDDEDDDDDDEDMDDAMRERLQEVAQQKEEVGHLERQIADKREQLARQSNPLLKSKLAATIKRFEEERDVKRRGMGMGMGDEEDDDDDD